MWAGPNPKDTATQIGLGICYMCLGPALVLEPAHSAKAAEHTVQHEPHVSPPVQHPVHDVADSAQCTTCNTHQPHSGICSVCSMGLAWGSCGTVPDWPHMLAQVHGSSLAQRPP